METFKNHFFKTVLGILILLILLISQSPVYAQDDYNEYDIVVEIEGMVCLFCSYGLEKDLNNMEKVEEVDVSFLDGLAKLVLIKNQQVTKEQTIGVITAAGYKAKNYIKFPDESSLTNSSDASDY